MGYKLETIKLSNFKAFYGTYEISVEGKNLLIYGENGSGKSSLYFALYTLLRAAVENKDKVKQYFNKDSEKYLGNIFAKEVPAIEIKLSSKNRKSLSYLLTYEENQAYEDEKLKSSLFASDFIDYRQVSRLSWKTMSQEMDIFEDMRYVLEVYPLTSPSDKTVWELYAEVKKGCFHIKKGKKQKCPKNFPIYNSYIENIEEFNDKISKIFYGCQIEANELLNKFFSDYNLELSFNIENAVWNHEKGEFKPPRVILKVNYHHKSINKPHVFLNESKLSAIGIAIRLALIKRRLQNSEFKLLFLDDILLSLDMSNRDQILQIIMNEFNDYQIIFMTHDRALFEMVKRRILSKKNLRKNWKCLEFYIGKSEGEFDIPIIKDSKNYLEQAEKFIENHNYYAAANYLRKEIEKTFKSLLGLPADYADMRKITLEKLKQQLEVRIKVISILDKLENLKESAIELVRELQEKENKKLIQKFISLLTEIIRSSNEIDTLDLNLKKNSIKHLEKLRDSLDSYTQRVLNPASHDNLDEPLYKKELETCLEIIKNLINLKTENS